MKLINEFRILRDHTKFLLLSRERPHIHTEVIHSDIGWKAIKDFVNSGKDAVWFVLTPVNIDFVRATFGYNGVEKGYEKIILPRYRWLESNGQEIQLHVHLHVALNLFTDDSSSRIQENKIKPAVSWMKKNNFHVNKVVFGWWSYNHISLDIAKKYGLKTINRLDSFYLHDYDLIK